MPKRTCYISNECITVWLSQATLDNYQKELSISYYKMKLQTLKFSGSNCLRQRLILSLLTGKTIIIDNIRPDGDVFGQKSGLNDHELNLLELIKKITSGTNLNINRTKTKLDFKPGSIIGGEFTHDCDVSRSISYYLEVVLSIAPFCKKTIKLSLTGVTDDQLDPTVDDYKYGALPILKRFIGDVEGSIDIKVSARGFKPEGGGKVLFTCPIVRQLKPVQWIDPGLVKRVRGLAVATRVSPQMSNRIIDTSKGMLLQYLPDVYIYSDSQKSKSSSPGFSGTLCAETTEGCFYTASAASNPKGSGKGPSLPEELAKEVTYSLFEEIQKNGCIDSKFQSIAFTFMIFNAKDVSKVKTGELTTYSIHFLRHLKQFCGVTFNLDSSEFPLLTATCVGIGFTNINRPTY